MVDRQRVFVNRTLNMKKITHVGFDMDHTLIRYNAKKFEGLAYQMILKRLVEDKGYPPLILKFQFDFARAIRGLVIDKRYGNILKLSRYGAIRVSYHGMRPIQFKDQKEIYKSVYVDLGDANNYSAIDTHFSIAFATLFSQLVELKDQAEGAALPDYATIATDVLVALDTVHRDGSLKSLVTKSLGDYIIIDEAVVAGLERLKRHEKKVFVLTNSDYPYTRLLLDYAINPFLREHKNWQELFNFVITSAQKPRFFYDNLKFLRIDPASGLMSNVEDPLTPGIYQGGCAHVFTRDLHLDPDEILYVGDHIYGDVLRLKKDCAWRTALVVEELEEEIDATRRAKPYTDQIEALMAKKLPFETELDELISQKIENPSPPSSPWPQQKRIDELMELISEIDRTLSPVIREQQHCFNPYWGEVMRAGIEESYFAHQVERFACIYMSKLSDFVSLSPRTYYRSHRRRLPHDDEEY